MNQITDIRAQAGQPLPVERIKDSLPALRGQWIQSAEEAEKTRVALAKLSEVAEPSWVGQRVVTMLSHYFVSDIHPAAQEAVARDWMVELARFPDWAIDAAVSWWLSRQNENRRKKPMPGDISERAHIEMAIVRIAQSKIEQFERYGDNPPTFMK